MTEIVILLCGLKPPLVFHQNFFHLPGRAIGVIQPTMFFSEADKFLKAAADAPIVDAEVLAQLVILVVLKDHIFIDIDQEVFVDGEQIGVSHNVFHITTNA